MFNTWGPKVLRYQGGNRFASKMWYISVVVMVPVDD